MKKRKYRKIFNSLFNFITISRKDFMTYGIFLVVLVSFISLGYAAFNQNIDIMNATAELRPTMMLRINRVSFNIEDSSADVDSIQDYNVNNIGVTVDLPYADSYAVYDVEINSRKFNDVGLFQITNLPENIDYEILNYNLGDKLCDENGNCNVNDLNCSGTGCTPIVTSTVKVKFFYKTGTYDSSNTTQDIVAIFDLRDMHSISYSEFDNSLPYPKEVIDGGTVTVNFNQYINSVSIMMDGLPLGTGEFTLSNNVLTIPNVTSDLEIINLTFYTITFDNMGGINGPSAQNVQFDRTINDVTPPTKAGYSFKGFYSSFDLTSLSYGINNYGSTYRINLIGDSRWNMNSNDRGRFFQASFTLTDNNLSSAPTDIEFNDWDTLDYYIEQVGDHSWTYHLGFELCDEMVSNRQYNYETDYRFIDIEGTTSGATVTVNYVYLDNGIYFDSTGKSLVYGNISRDLTLYAKWVDDIAPVLEYTATHGVNSGDTYTSGTWTNRNIYTNITVTEQGDGLDSNLIQYSLDNGTTWYTFNFGARNLSISNGVYTGTESWSLPAAGSLRTGDVLLRACDVNGLCDTKSYSFKYDRQTPTINSGESFSYPTGGTTLQLVVSASDGSGSGIKEYKFGTSDTSSCSGVTWGSSNIFTASNLKYICVKVTDNVGNETINAYAAKYLIIANSNGGSIASTSGWSGTGGSATTKIVFNGTYGTLPTSTKSGYEFKGWTLDDNYIILDSITSNGYEYIDTGFADSNGIRAVYKAAFLDTTGGYIVGSHNESSPYGRNGAYWSERTQWEMGYGEICPSNGSGSVGTIYEVDFKTTYNDAYLKVKEAGSSTYIVNNTYSGQTISTYNNYLFFNQYSEQYGGASTKATVYYVKIYNSSGTLVRDYVPAKRASDGIIGMYDKLNGVFYTTKRAGVFTGGTTSDMISSSSTIKQTNHTIYAVYADETGPTISNVTLSWDALENLNVNISASDPIGIVDYSYAYSSGTNCSSLTDYVRATGNSFTLATVSNDYLCVKVRDNEGNVSYSYQSVPYIVKFSGSDASGLPSSVSSSTTSVTLPSTVPTRSNSEFIGWSTTSGATTVMYTAGQTITVSSRKTTLYPVWKTYIWDEYNIKYDPYSTGENSELTISGTKFYAADSYSNNNNGTVTLNMSTKIYWALITAGNQDDAGGHWVSTVKSSASTETVSTFYYIRSATYWVPTFTVKVTKWQIAQNQGSATGNTVSSTYSNTYPSSGVSNGKYYVRRT